jgi:hypothetical protein
MLELAGEHTAGALTYLVTPAHTQGARSALGASPALCVEQAVTLTDDVEEARRIGRKHLEIYLGFPNYVNNWMRLGFTDDDGRRRRQRSARRCDGRCRGRRSGGRTGPGTPRRRRSPRLPPGRARGSLRHAGAGLVRSVRLLHR